MKPYFKSSSTIQKIGGLLALLVALPMSVKAVTITVSIPPLAGMIAPLLSDEDELYVLLKQGVSPHGYQLKPSDLSKIQQSDLVVSVGTPVDAWITKPIRLLDKASTSMAELPGGERLAIRAGGLWGTGHLHQHDALDDHANLTDHAEHADNHHEMHDALTRKSMNNASQLLKPVVGDSRLDGHLWMSIDNSTALIKAVAHALQTLNPKGAAAIELRLQSWLNTVSAADSTVNQALQGVKSEPYLVLHDAFQYFEQHYGLNGVGSIRLNPELPPSLKRIYTLRKRIKAGHVTCLFKEPQFPEKRVKAVISGLNVRVGSLDPMGVYDGHGRAFVSYDQFLKNLANQFLSCLSVEGQ